MTGDWTLAADAQAGRGGWGENGLESTPLGDLAGSLRAAAAPAQAGLPPGPSPLDSIPQASQGLTSSSPDLTPMAWSPKGTSQSIHHLNRCLVQAEPDRDQPPRAGAAAGASAPAPSDPADLPPQGAAAPGTDPQVAALYPARRISLEAEIPEALFDGMRAFIQARPDWDQYRLVTSALAGFLFQHGWADGCVSQHYLNGLFRDEAA